MQIREIHVFNQEVHWHAGQEVRPAAIRVAAAAVLHNPHAGAPRGVALEEYVEASVAVGEILAQRCLTALDGRTPVSYGKGVLVGAGGDLEQGAAMIHCKIGLAMRKAIRAGYALIPGNAKMAAPDATLDVILGGIDDGWNYDAMDTLQVRVPGAPRSDEIVLVVAFATGRPNARIAGASALTVTSLVDQLRSGAA